MNGRIVVYAATCSAALCLVLLVTLVGYLAAYHPAVWDVDPGDGAVGYVYSWGVGVFSHIYAQDNYFPFTGGEPASQIIVNWGGTVIHAADNLVNGRQTDILAAYNAANPSALIGDDTSWAPVYRDHVDPPQAVPALVGHWAGAARAG